MRVGAPRRSPHPPTHTHGGRAPQSTMLVVVHCSWPHAAARAAADVAHFELARGAGRAAFPLKVRDHPLQQARDGRLGGGAAAASHKVAVDAQTGLRHPGRRRGAGRAGGSWLAEPGGCRALGAGPHACALGAALRGKLVCAAAPESRATARA
jgi:hypothetical protein